MRRRTRAIAAGAVLVLALLSASPSTALACTSEQPTFVEAVRGARAIARVTILEGFDSITVDPTSSETYRVERVLKGVLPERLTVAPAWTSLCRDPVSLFAGAEPAEGTTVIVAFDLRYHDQVIHPVWAADPGGGVWGSAEVPAGVASLAALEAAILAELGPPDTSTPGDGDAVDWPLPALVGVAGLLAFVLMRRRVVDRTGGQSAR